MEIFIVKCPKCGKEFSIKKGVTMQWDFSRPIPKKLLYETPFKCPKCGHQMSMQDKDSNRHILLIQNVD